MQSMPKAKDELTYEKVWVRVKSAMSGKVDREKGKGLSTCDYTAEDKEKVENISRITNQQIDDLFRKEC